MSSQDADLTAVRNLYDAFNDPTADRVMTAFAEDAVYEDPMGRRHDGKAAVRAVLAPTFNGAQRYTLRDVVCVAETVVATWSLEVGPTDGRLRLEGIDVLRFANGKIALKQCFMKATGLLMEPADA